MAHKAGSDYIPTAYDIACEKDAQEQRRLAAKERGFKLGTYKLTYEVFSSKFEQLVKAETEKDAVDSLKEQCGLVGWIPTNIKIETLEEPNIYV